MRVVKIVTMPVFRLLFLYLFPRVILTSFLILVKVFIIDIFLVVVDVVLLTKRRYIIHH